MTIELDLRRLDQVVEALATPLPELVGGILANLTDTIDLLHVHLEAAQLGQAARTAHACRNDALLVGARALLQTLTDIEHSAREDAEDQLHRARLALDEVWPATQAALAEVANGPGSRGMTGDGARVLVVDDHELNLKLLRRVLELGGYDVADATTLAAARAVIREGLPGLIVLDLQLPDGDGLDLARELKASPATSRTVIVACTAEAMRGDAERALAAGCDAYVSKPIDTYEFSALVDELLGRSPGPRTR